MGQRPALTGNAAGRSGQGAGAPRRMRLAALQAAYRGYLLTGDSAPAERCLTAETLASLSPEQLDTLPIRLSRHARIVSAEAPLHDLWRAHQKPEPDLSGIDMSPRPHALLICRPDRLLVVQELD